MKRRFEVALVLATLGAFAACQSEAEAPARVGESEAAQQGNSRANISITELDTTVGDCEVTRCFDVSSSKDISHISIEADACPGAEISYALYSVDNGELEFVTSDTTEVGNDQSCAGQPVVSLDPDARKFDGLSDPRYVVCVTYEGVVSPNDITVVAKSGTSCEDATVADSCEGCDEDPPPNGAGGGGGAGGQGGAGGGGGAGGSGGDDDCPDDRRTDDCPGDDDPCDDDDSRADNDCPGDDDPCDDDDSRTDNDCDGRRCDFDDCDFDDCDFDDCDGHHGPSVC